MTPQRRSEPIIEGERIVWNYIHGPTSQADKEVQLARNGRIAEFRYWGPHLLDATYPNAGNPLDIVVVVSQHDQRPPAQYIRAMYKIIDPKSAREWLWDMVFCVSEGRVIRNYEGSVLLTGTDRDNDNWIAPFLDYKKTSGLKPR